MRKQKKFSPNKILILINLSKNSRTKLFNFTSENQLIKNQRIDNSRLTNAWRKLLDS